MVDLGFDEQGVLIRDLDEELGSQMAELESIGENKIQDGNNKKNGEERNQLEDTLQAEDDAEAELTEIAI